MSKPIIGILGGMGPKSTAPFLEILISEGEKIINPKSDFDYPPIIIYSLPTPYFYEKPFDFEEMKKIICKGLKHLEKCGVSFIGMPSNTMHIFYEDLKNCINIPFLNIIDATINEIPKNSKKAVILGTKAIIESNLYQNALEKLKIECIESDEIYALAEELLFNIKTAKELNTSINLYKKLEENILKLNIDLVLIACTDLNVVTNRVTSPFTIIDSSYCLAKACINKWKKLL